MSNVIVVGDGPGGLSAALFLAKNGVPVAVYGQDKTAMHFAMLSNYLGIPQIHGSEFQRIAREQVIKHGAELIDARVESVSRVDDGFAIKTGSGETATAAYVILSEGKGARLAKSLGLEYEDEAGIATDRNGRTSIPGVYVVGRSARPGRSQAIISAGDGAACAIDILSILGGENVCDWDSPPES